MKDRLLIVGSHPGTRNLIPWDDDCDIWTINEAATMKESFVKRCTAIFQLHPRSVWENPKNNNDPHHGEWLKANREVTVYMLDVFPDVPMSVKYPLDEIQDKFMSQLSVFSPRGRNRVFTTTVAYMFALAAYLGYKQVDVYGVELSVESEYRYQRPGAMFWLGVLTQHANVNFYGQMLDAPLYGFEIDGEISKDDLVARLAQIAPEVDKLKAVADTANQAFIASYNRFRDTGVEHEITAANMRALTDALTKHSEMDGRKQEIERRLTQIDEQLKLDTNFRFSHHEFERAETAILAERQANLLQHAHISGYCDGLFNQAVKHRLIDSKRKQLLSDLDKAIPQLYVLLQKSAIFVGAAAENHLLASLVREQLLGVTDADK